MRLRMGSICIHLRDQKEVAIEVEKQPSGETGIAVWAWLNLGEDDLSISLNKDQMRVIRDGLSEALGDKYSHSADLELLAGYLRPAIAGLRAIERSFEQNGIKMAREVLAAEKDGAA